MIDALKAEAERIGFDFCGVASAGLAPEADFFKRWIEAGCHAGMEWMAREVERRTDPAQILPGAKAVVIVGMNCYQVQPVRRGRVAMYALGRDYHELLLPMLEDLAGWLARLGGVQRCYVDTGPILEKNLARLSGVGWQGKNTLLIHPQGGCWFMLGCVLTTLELEIMAPVRDHCGSCQRCMSACPTRAIVEPYHLDARRCLAYYSIEHKGAIPVEFREAMGDRVYGCDECLAACPWNRFAQQTRHAGLAALELPDLREMLYWGKEDFNRLFRHSPVKRLKLSRWKRNIAVALGNIGTGEDVLALEHAAAEGDELVTEHAEWALLQIRKRLGNMLSSRPASG